MTATFQIAEGDNIATLRTLPDACLDSIVTDAPYGLGKEPDPAALLRSWLDETDHDHGKGGGFMGCKWDAFVPSPAIWRECLRVLKPGGYLLSFFGSRTYHWGATAVALAGFEIRDQIDWLYGQGMPKSLDVGRQIDMFRCRESGRAGKHCDKNLPPPAKRQVDDHLCEPHADGEPWRGHRTALSPAHEPIVMARKPLIGTLAANVLAHGTGGLDVDGCRIGLEKRTNAPAGNKPGTHAYKMGVYSMPQDAKATECVGRWPANVIMDEAAAVLLDEQSGQQKTGTAVRRNGPTKGGATSFDRPKPQGPDVPAREAGGGASRFFYCAKTSAREREAGLDAFESHTAGELTGGRAEGSAGLKNARSGAGRTSSGRKNTHPTVKPVALMRFLCRLVTPAGGVVLDPFAGSGSTGVAAVLEGYSFLGCELDPDYCEIARARIAHAVESNAADSL